MILALNHPLPSSGNKTTTAMRFFLVIFLFLGACSFQANAQDFRTHKVGDDDTVYSLSIEYNTTEEAIYTLNPGSRQSIRLGQVLRIPPMQLGATNQKPMRFVSYVVQPKETVFGISQQHGIAIADLKKYNPYLYMEELGMGDTIRIPVYTKEKPQPIDYNASIRNSSFGNLKHVVLPGETRFSIAQKYGVELQQLKDLNPGMGVIINPGDVLTVSRQGDGVEKNFFYYTVEPYHKGSKETVYSLTRKFNVTKEALFALNPTLEMNGLEAGMKIKIPKPAEGDFLFETAETTKVVQLDQKLQYFEPKELVVMLPFKLNDYKTDTLSRRIQLKRNRLSQISLDFYSGVKMALNEAEAHGISVNTRVYDTEASEYRVQEIIRNNYFGNVQAVIGPLLAKEVEMTAQMLQRKSIPVFSPLTKKNMVDFDNLVQTRPSDLYMEDVMIDYLFRNHTTENILIIADTDKQRITQKLQAKFPSAKVFVPILQQEDDYLKKEEIAEHLVPGAKNWVIIESDEVLLLNIATSYLDLLQEEDYQIQLFTTNRNNTYENDGISNANLSSLAFTFPSFTNEYGNSMGSAFVEKYRNKYGIKPSQFAVRGYDLTYDILLRLTATKDLNNSLIAPWTTEYVENKFHYQKGINGTYINRAVYILQFGEDLSIKPVQ